MTDLWRQLQSRLEGQYTLERELGGGGMSRVFLATEIALARKVVLKVLPVEDARLSPERFKREIAVAARLQHPHVVPLLSAGDAGGTPYFTMPYIAGDSLRAKLAANGELPISEAVRILRQVASALAFAHDAGVVHRDIKPDNILLVGDAAMVTDFGVAKALSESTDAGGNLTDVGVALGTPAYMSPEQATAEPHLDHRSDIYSWGVLAYELLTQSTPFGGRSPQAMLAAHATEPAVAVELRRPLVPPPLAHLVMRCLEKRPADRPQNALEITRALDDLGLTTSGAHAPGARRPVLARRIVIAAASVAVAAAGWLLFSRDSTVPPLVAVLPFAVTAGDTAIDYLADGLSDGLSAELQRKGVRVTPRATTYALGMAGLDPRVIAQRLDAGSVVVGRVRALDRRLHVVFDLISRDGQSVTQGALELDAGDAQAIKDTILADLLRALLPRDVTPRSAAGRGRHEVSAEVYDLFLRALHLRNTFTRENIDRAITLFDRAIRLDSTYAPLHAELGWTYMMLADAYVAPREVIPQATRSLQTALALDDSLAEAHGYLAALYQQYLFRWYDVEPEVLRALELNPDLSDSHIWRAASQMTHGDRAGAVKSVERSLALDPLSPLAHFSAVWFYTVAGMPDSAIARYHRLREIDPGFFYLETFVDDAYRMKGQADSALAIATWGATKAERPLGGQILALVDLHREAEARRLFAELERVSRERYIPPEILARSALALGDREKAIDYLERGAEAQSALVQMVQWYSDFDVLADDPRYQRYQQGVRLAGRMRSGANASRGR